MMTETIVCNVRAWEIETHVSVGRNPSRSMGRKSEFQFPMPLAHEYSKPFHIGDFADAKFNNFPPNRVRFGRIDFLTATPPSRMVLGT